MEKLAKCNLEFVREDDFVEYFVFPTLPENLSPAGNDDAERETRNFLKTIQAQCRTIVDEHITRLKYIWHKDEFQLQIRTGSVQERLLNDETACGNSAATETPLAPHLHGVTHFGDDISDEWLIVYLLYELTRAIPGCVARIIDSDGEFLLIEAADVLPKWANPTTCEQRVYIADGHLQMVQNSPSNTAKLLPVQTAVEKIRQNPTLYRVSKEIQECIDQRIKEFKDATNSSLHHQIVRLPLGVAALLREKPALIAAAVRAFCDRDPIDMKACRTMRFFPPEQRVRTNVRFTRCLYAMLMHCDYVPDRKIGWNLSGATNTEQYKEDLLGVKIASGFEILASQAKDKNNIENESAWRTYLRSLTTKGYFHDNLEGSEEYKRLLAEAKSFYKENNERFRTAPLVGGEILEMLETIDINSEQLFDAENNLQPSDADDWLNVSAEQLDAMLMERYGPQKLYKPNGELNAEEFTKNLAEFLEKQSGLDGIENDSDSDDDSCEEPTTHSAKVRKEEFKAKVKKNHSMRKACKQNSVIGDAGKTNQKKSNVSHSDDDDGHSTNVRNFLDFVIPEDNWGSNSEMSDYEDDDDLERNFEAMANSDATIDSDIKKYMAQMDRELAQTTIGQSFVGRGKTRKAPTAEDDFDDIESFEPININVNTLKNMMDSYKSQIGGAGPVSNLLNAMGVGMSAAAAAASEDDDSKDLKESSV